MPDATTIAAPAAAELAQQIRRNAHAGFQMHGSPRQRPTQSSEEIGDSRHAISPEASAVEAADDSALGVRVRSHALRVLAWLAVLYTLYAARVILFPITLALVLCLLLRPLVRSLAQFRIPTFVAAALVEGLLVATVALGVTQLLQPAQNWVNNSTIYLANIEAQLQPVTRSLSEIHQASEKVGEITNGEHADAVPVVQKEPGMATILIANTSALLATVGVTLVLLYFLLASGDTYLNRIVELAPTFRGKREAVEVFRAIEGGVSNYLFTFTIINICLGTIEGLAMWLLGMPNPALWGVMAAVLNFVPFLGPLLGTIVVGLVALAEFDRVGNALVVPLVYVAITTLEGNFITPAIFGRSMHLNPVMVILSLVFWGWIWGVGGALLAVPLLAAVKIAFERMERFQPLAKFLAG